MHADAHRRQAERRRGEEESKGESERGKMPDIDPEKANQMSETVLEMMSHITIMDVERTVSSACIKVLGDHSVDTEVTNDARARRSVVVGRPTARRVGILEFLHARWKHTVETHRRVR